MAFQAVYNSLDEVPQEHREHYKQVGDQYHLDTDFKALGFEDVTQLKSANARLKDERNGLRTQVQELDKLKKFSHLLDIEGFDPSEVEALMAKAGSGDGAAQEQVEAITRRHKKELEALQAQLEESQGIATSAEAEKTNYIIDNELRKAAIKGGVDPDSLDDVVDLNRDKVKLVGKSVTYVDKDGDPTVAPEDYFSGDYKKEKPHFYKPEGNGGSGQPSKPGGAGGAADQSFKDAKSTDDKVEAIRQKRLAAGKEA